MNWTRREMLKMTAVGALAGAWGTRLMAEEAVPVPLVGACDWNLAGTNHPGCFAMAKEIGLDGSQVSFMMTEEAAYDLRKPEVQKLFLRNAEETGMKIASFAIGNGNDCPFWQLDDAVQRMSDCLRSMVAMGCAGKCVLLPFFGKASMDTDDKVVETIKRLKRVAPCAKDLGVTIALELPQHSAMYLRIIQEVDSPAVRAYYDPGNMVSLFNGNTDAICEDILKLTGLIAEAHAKDTGLLGKGVIDYAKIMVAYRKAGYTGWQVLEGSVDAKLGHKESYRRNAEYLRKLGYKKA